MEAATSSSAVDNTTVDDAGFDGESNAFGTMAPAETASEGYVPALDTLDFQQLLNNNTTIYYHRAGDSTEKENSGQTTDWHKVDEDTILGENDILRVYLAYTIPAGSLNETNETTRYHLPDNLHLTDKQIDDINQMENGLSSLYMDYETLQVTNPEKHSRYLGAEAIDGHRTPDQTVDEYLPDKSNEDNGEQAAQETISAVVKAEHVYEEDPYGKKDDNPGTDLVFTFSPSTLLKNRNEYDSEGKPVKTGEGVSGWFALDINMDQVEWDNNSAEIIFASENEKPDSSLAGVKLQKADSTLEKTDSEYEGKTDSRNSDVEKDIDDSSSAEENNADVTAETHPAVSFEDSLTVRTGSLGSDTDAASIPESSKLTVSVSAEAGTFPAGTTMALSAVTDMDSVAEAVEGTVNGKTCGFQAVDISFRDKDGNEIEPLKPISVTMRSDSIKAATEDSSIAPVVVHIEDRDKETAEADESPATTVIDTLPNSAETKENSDIPDTSYSSEELSFESEAFSVYAIVYTVDFYYEVNGEGSAFSMAGEDAVSLRDLALALHIVGEENIDTFLADIGNVTFSNPELLAVVKAEKEVTLGKIKAENNISQDFAMWEEQGEVERRNGRTFRTGDWVLISLKPFSSQEKLTISLVSGQQIEILVTDAQDAPMKEDGIHVDTLPNPSGTTIDLFDYWVDNDLKDSAGRSAWPGYYDGWYYHDENDYEWYKSATLLGTGNEAGINNGHMFKFSPAWAGTVYEGTIPNKENPELYSPTRNPTNVSYTNDGDRLYYAGGLNSYTGGGDPRQGLVEATLDNGYPRLTDDDSLGTNGESLSYLFTRESSSYKDYYGNVDHLLYVDRDGYYTYDSRDYNAVFNGNDGFELTEQTSTDTEVRGFWPFGQQKFWVGMHLNTQFSMPQNGQVLNPKDELKDMQFEFSGDDDTWLYVDGVLIGDGGGIHNRTEIDVNFATGKSTVTGKKDANHSGSFEETLWLDDIFKAAGRYNDDDWEEIPGTTHKRFKAGTYHTFDMFYLERGGGESNLYIHYNLVSTEDFTGHKSYEGFMDDERMSRDQFHFEMIGLDGQYESVRNEETQTETVTLVDAEGRAIMPMTGTENGQGTFEDPRKTYSSSAYTDSAGTVYAGTVFTTGVTENGDIRFGSANISAEEMQNCDQGHPSLYRYIFREIVPDDAVNEDGVRWDEADDAQKAAGGFVKDQVRYDHRTYYMTARVTSWDQTGVDGQTYKAYGLSKTYYTDDTFTVVDSSVSFIDFRNLYAPDRGSVSFTKIDGSNHPLPGAEFTLYIDSACTKVAKDLGDADAGISGAAQVKTSGTDGRVSFENMAAPRTYYMKETAVPDGYEPNPVIYKVIIESSKDNSRKSRIVIVQDGEETEIKKIVNAKAGEISVVKEWQDQNGNAVSGDGHTARVKIQRKHYQQEAGSGAHRVAFTIQISGKPELTYTYTADNITGSEITIDWWDTNVEYSSITVSAGGSEKEYSLSNYWDNANHKNRKLTIADVSTDIVVVVEYPSDKDWLFNSNHTDWMKNVWVAGSEPVLDLVEDTEFNASSDSTHFATLKAPDWCKKWTIGNDGDFPATDGTHPYRYYVVEVDEDGTAYEIGEESDAGYKLVGYSAENTDGITGQGAVFVYNQIKAAEPIDITVMKYDRGDLEDLSAETLSGASFRLEKYTASDYQGKDDSWTEQLLEDTEESGHFTFTGLGAGFYKIVEVDTPDGYVKISEDPTFEVRTGDSGKLEVVFSDTDFVKYSKENGFRFGNEPGAALPHTGGPGTRLFTILGSFLILGAGALLWRKRRFI